MSKVKAFIKDTREIVVLIFLGIISILTPAHKWDAVCRILSHAAHRLHQGKTGKTVSAARHINQFSPESKIQTIDNRTIVHSYFKSRLTTMDQHLLRKWNPEISVKGLEHFHHSCSQGKNGKGKGRIFLVANFAYSSLIVKMALHHNGIKVSHLSHPAHGYSNTKFGRKVLNKIRTSIENRYLQQRIILSDHNYAVATRRLHRLLQNRETISITLGADTANPVEVPLFDGNMKISSVPFRLAISTNALIFPVFAVQNENNKYEVIIQPPLNSGNAIRDGKNCLNLCIAKYARCFEEIAIMAPEQIRGELYKFERADQS